MEFIGGTRASPTDLLDPNLLDWLTDGFKKKDYLEIDGILDAAFTRISGQPLLKKRPVWWKILSNVLFYCALLFLLLAAILSAGSSATPRNLLGFSYFSVQTPSMKEVLPPGTLIVTHKTAPEKLKVGDIITYWSISHTDTITHRIYSIHGSGVDLSFETKGDSNEAPDEMIVPPDSVIGTVIFSLKGAGKTLEFIKRNIALVLVLFVLLVALSATLDYAFRKTGTEPLPRNNELLEGKRQNKSWNHSKNSSAKREMTDFIS